MYNYGFPNYQQPQTDIGQVGSEQEAINAYVAAGRSKIMFSSDDKTIYVKCVAMNGQSSMDIFDRRAIRPEKPVSDYITREELDEILKGLKTPEKAVKKEAAV